MVKKCRKQRETPSEEGDIPLMEPAKQVHENDVQKKLTKNKNS